MMARLSTLPVEDWWGQFSTTDREEARALFASMRSDAGFVLDLRYGSAPHTTERVEALQNVRCPTLVTGSPHDRGVSFAHARDLAERIPGAVLAELDAPTHLFWLGPGRFRLMSLIGSFLADGRDPTGAHS